MVTLFLSLAVIVVVAGVVGHLCSVSRPGARKLGPAAPPERGRSHIAWPGVFGDSGSSGGYVNLPDTQHHSGWGHSHGHAHSHDSGGWGWGGDSGGGLGGDSGGGGGGGD